MRRRSIRHDERVALAWMFAIAVLFGLMLFTGDTSAGNHWNRWYPGVAAVPSD